MLIQRLWCDVNNTYEMWRQNSYWTWYQRFWLDYITKILIGCDVNNSYRTLRQWFRLDDITKILIGRYVNDYDYMVLQRFWLDITSTILIGCNVNGWKNSVLPRLNVTQNLVDLCWGAPQKSDTRVLEPSTFFPFLLGVILAIGSGVYTVGKGMDLYVVILEMENRFERTKQDPPSSHSSLLSFKVQRSCKIVVVTLRLLHTTVL